LIGYFTPSGGASLGPAQIDVPFGMKAYLRTNGEYLIFVEDDWFGKILMYRWTPGAVLSGTAVNCGGTATGSFVADPFSGGNTASTNAGIDTAGVINPAPQAVYQTNRYTTSGTNSFTYTLGGLTPNATYMARLHFAETYFGTAGSREFNVSINNKPVLTNFDIFVAAGGGNMANIQQFWATSGTNGQFTFTFANGSQNNAQCNGIEISPILAAPPSALTATSGSAQIGLSWTASPGADRYNVYRALGTSGSFALLASSTSAGYTDASVSNTTSYCYAVTAVNAGGESADSNQSSTTVILPPLQLWRMQNFGTLNPADPVAGDTADPAACGVSNLTRYALGLSLNGNDPTGLPTVSQSGGYLSLSFTRLKADTDITYHVVAGGDLNLWNEIWNSTAVPYGGSANPQQQVTVPDTVSISSAPGGRRFLKLKVTNP